MNRNSGVLLHISSLPARYGIGTLGESAYRFVDFLAATGQSYWQVLPMNPTGYGDSPYQSPSVFAGNPYFIDPDLLASEGLLKREEYQSVDFGTGEGVDYARQFENRYRVLRAAFARFRTDTPEDYRAFERENSAWLTDYALFMALKAHFGYVSFSAWEDKAKTRDADFIAAFAVTYAEEINFWKFLQYEFFTQWRALKSYAQVRGIRLIGDMPIYAAYDSADVWAHPENFLLNESYQPVVVAGVPPDCFSEEGQLWGNPVYDWTKMEEDGFAWWLSRIAFSAQMFDVVRIDHFRGFAGYYVIPFGETTAKKGEWRVGPGMRLFDKVRQEIPGADIIAEDLGLLDDAVRTLLARSGYPGMKVLQFGFDGSAENEYYPKNIRGHYVVYPGTHDNTTTQAWYETLTESQRAMFKAGTGRRRSEAPAAALIRAAYKTEAETVIVPMQDWLQLGASARMNTPATLGGNWVWRMNGNYNTAALRARMRRYGVKYKRVRA